MTATAPDMDFLLAKRELDLEKRRLALRVENQIYFYTPHEKQQQFHQAASFHYRYARTGNRFGKSEMGAAEDIAFALGYRPWIVEGDPGRTLGIPTHPTKGLIVTTDWDKSTEVFTETAPGPTQGKLFKYIPKSAFISSEKNHSGAIDTIRVRHISGGISVIHLDTVKSFKQNPLGSESSSWDWVHFDEPVPVEMYNALIRGLIDRDGYVWFTCTPLTEPWIDAKFIPDAEDQTKGNLATFSNGDFWMMTGSTDDNPFNTHAAIERVMAQYPEEEQETRRSGTPKAYFGLVCKEFQWNLHIRRDAPVGWKDWRTPPENYCIRFAIDYHPRKPHHVLFIATSPQERQYIYNEIFLSCLMQELVTEIRLVLQLKEATVPGLIDPLADTPNRVTDITPLEEILRLGLPVMPATKDPHNGILKIKELLGARDRADNAMLQINPECRRTVFEISRGWMWDKDTNKPEKKNDDAMENFYRLCLQGLSYIEPAETYTRPPVYTIPSYENVISHHFDTSFEETPKTAKRSAAFSSRYRR